MLTVNLQRLTSATLSITSAFAGFCVFPKHKCIYLHMRPSARAPDLSPDKTHCGLQQMDTDTHTQGQKRTMRSHQSSHTQQQPWESWKRIALSLSLSFLTQCLIYLIYLTTCLCPITPSSFPLNSLLAAMHMCVSLCVCLVETALLDKGPQGSFVKIVKHCVGLVAGDRAGVREKQGNAFRYN